MTILMCAQKLTDASLIYRTVQKTKTSKNGYAQKKRCRARNRGVSPEITNISQRFPHIMKTKQLAHGTQK